MDHRALTGLVRKIQTIVPNVERKLETSKQMVILVIFAIIKVFDRL
ncbi:hypothetical protein [Bacillus cereus]|nr:hypothetical protein [Bacillus cereus]